MRLLMHQLLINHEQSKMKSVILVALALVAVAAALPADEPVGIVRSEFNQEAEGGYNYGYETENGIVRSEVGVVKEVLDEDKKPHKVVVVRGSYAYTDKDGNTENINYFADESGYHAEGPSVPKAV